MAGCVDGPSVTRTVTCKHRSVGGPREARISGKRSVPARLGPRVTAFSSVRQMLGNDVQYPWEPLAVTVHATHNVDVLSLYLDTV